MLSTVSRHRAGCFQICYQLSFVLTGGVLAGRAAAAGAAGARVGAIPDARRLRELLWRLLPRPLRLRAPRAARGRPRSRGAPWTFAVATIYASYAMKDPQLLRLRYGAAAVLLMSFH